MTTPAPPITAADHDPSLRLFIGLWPHDEVRQALAEHQAGWQWPAGAKPTRPEKLHLTLHFLGAVAASRVPALHAALQGVQAGALTLPWQGVERWGGGLAVLRTAADPRLDVLHAQIGEVLRAQGLPVESRPLKPHVTLARKAAGAQPPERLPSQPWRSDGCVLVVSAGGRYEMLGRYA